MMSTPIARLNGRMHHSGMLLFINGHEGVVKLLLGREDINPNLPDKRGDTPLSHAMILGRPMEE